MILEMGSTISIISIVIDCALRTHSCHANQLCSAITPIPSVMAVARPVLQEYCMDTSTAEVERVPRTIVHKLC